MENNYLGNFFQHQVSILENSRVSLSTDMESYLKSYLNYCGISNKPNTKQTKHVCFDPSLLFLGASKRQFKRLCMCVAHKDAKKFAIFLCIWKQKFVSFFLLLFWQPVQIFVFLWYGRIFWFKIQISSESLRSSRQFVLFLLDDK